MLRDVAEGLREGVLKAKEFLLTSESEIRQILAQMLETNLSQIPVMLLQIQFERFILQAVDILRKDLETSIKQIESTIYGNK